MRHAHMQVTTGSGGTQVPAGTVTRNYDPTNPSEEVTITISTIGWGPDTYQVRSVAGHPWSVLWLRWLAGALWT